MNSYDYLKEKQIHWALNRGVELHGSEGDRGTRAYCSSIDENLFEPLSTQARDQISSGDGGELESKGNQRSRMQAVHSSSVLPVNVFQYWQSVGDFDAIASACGFCRSGSCPSIQLRFEEKFPILENSKMHPNMDVTFVNKPASRYDYFAIESKFTEPYGGRAHGGIKEVYFEDKAIWKGLPNLRKLAEEISPNDNRFVHLHAAQLIKHILGLSRMSGSNGRFRLLYLWYDVFGIEGVRHLEEIEQFKKIAKEDGVKFDAISYQELIMKLANQLRSSHPEYIEYLVGRYL